MTTRVRARPETQRIAGAVSRPRRPRRSQTERTAETHARVTAAVIASIAEVGFKRATGVEITRRAGVTWGAVQHQFGNKDGILVAIVEDSFGRSKAARRAGATRSSPSSATR